MRDLHRLVDRFAQPEVVRRDDEPPHGTDLPRHGSIREGLLRSGAVG